MNWWEIVVLSIMTIITTWHTFIAWRYIYTLNKDIEKGKYIGDSYHHSHAHFGIVGVLMLISIFMYYNTFSGDLQWLFFEHILYNLACIFVIYPHLFSEK